MTNDYTPTEAWVYFMRPVGARGPVKIGYARQPWSRLRQIEKHSPVSLEVAALIRGTQKVERRFHGLFAADHMRDEWFNGSDRLDAVIAEISAGTFELERLPRSVALWLVAAKAAA